MKIKARRQRFIAVEMPILAFMVTLLASLPGESATVRSCEGLFAGKFDTKSVGTKGAGKSTPVRITSASKDYLAIVDWLYESWIAIRIMTGDASPRRDSFEPTNSRFSLEQAFANYGVVLKNQWAPKTEFKDPEVQERVIQGLLEIVKEQMAELRDAANEEEREIAVHRAEKKTLALFEENFGPLPETIGHDGTRYSPQEFQQKFFSRYSSHSVGEDFSFARMLARAKQPLAEISPHLTLQQVEILKKHPIFAWAKALGDGSKLAFGSRFYRVGQDMMKYKGERGQMFFNWKILRTLFPKAEFINDRSEPTRGRQKVAIWTGDLAEKFAGTPHDIKRLEDKGATIPMILGKAANTSGVRKDKAELRKVYGFPPNRKIVHLYIRAEDTLDQAQYGLLLQAINAAMPLDIVVVTFGNHVETLTFRDCGITEAFGWQKVSSFGGSLAGENLPARTIVENTTVGRMSDLHRIADLSVVVGPVNFFEPVHVGTPTLLIAKTDAAYRKSDYGAYDRTTLEKYADLAERSGIFAWLPITRDRSDYSPVTTLVTVLNNSNENPVSLSDVTFKLYLDALLKHLKYRMGKPNPRDYEGLNFN